MQFTLHDKCFYKYVDNKGTIQYANINKLYRNRIHDIRQIISDEK